MSTSDPIAPDRLEALLRGEAGSDGRERRIGALLDELTVGEITPPAELRERVRSLTTAPADVVPAPRRLPGLRLRRPRLRLAPVLGVAAVAAVIVGVVATQTRTSSTPLAKPPHLTAADQQSQRASESADDKVLRHPAARTAARRRRRRPPPRLRCRTGSAPRTTRLRCGSRSGASPSSRARRRACSTPCARSAAPS